MSLIVCDFYALRNIGLYQSYKDFLLGFLLGVYSFQFHMLSVIHFELIIEYAVR